MWEKGGNLDVALEDGVKENSTMQCAGAEASTQHGKLDLSGRILRAYSQQPKTTGARS